MKYLLFIPLLLLTFFVNQPVFAQTNNTPTLFYCVGNNTKPPCVTVPPSLSTNETTNQTISVSPKASTNTNSSTDEDTSDNSSTSPSVTPCTQISKTEIKTIKKQIKKIKKKVHNIKHHHSHRSGFIQKLINKISQLIKKLLHIEQKQSQNPCPSPSASPSVSPSVNPSPGTSVTPSISVTPIVPTPTIFRGNTPTPTISVFPTLPGSSICSGAQTQGRYQHIIWIVFENTQASTALSSMPYLAQLGNQCGLATNFWAETHPSLPNYIAMTSGSTQGISGDSSGILGVDNIYNQVKQKGLQWRQYSFGMPSNCYQKDNPPAPNAIYTAHHEAAIFYSNISSDCKNWDVPVGSPTKVSDPSDISNSPLATALDTNTLPAFAIMGPTDDGGNSNVGGEVDPNLGNQFLQRWIPRITSSTAYKSGTVAIFITFDEPQDFKVIPPKQPIATVVIAPSVKPGTKSGVMFTHYSMLKTTEELLGITTFLGHAGDPTTSDMRSAFNL